jgi:hypothetical protein
MEQVSGQVVIFLLAAASLVGAWFWVQVRPSHRVRRALQRADARARSMHRH